MQPLERCQILGRKVQPPRHHEVGRISICSEVSGTDAASIAQVQMALVATLGFGWNPLDSVGPQTVSRLSRLSAAAWPRPWPPDLCNRLSAAEFC